MKMLIRLETKSGEIYFGDPYEVDFNNVNYLWINKRKCTQQELDEVMRALFKHKIQLDDMRDWVEIRIVKPSVGCHLINVKSHYDESGIRVIDDFKIDSINLVSNPVDEHCILIKGGLNEGKII